MYHILKQERINMMRFASCSWKTLVREKIGPKMALIYLPSIKFYGEKATRDALHYGMDSPPELCHALGMKFSFTARR